MIYSGYKTFYWTNNVIFSGVFNLKAIILK